MLKSKLQAIVATVFFALCLATSALAYPLDDVFTRVTDADGHPVSGAKYCVFVATTTTPVTTYSDAALSTAQAHPVVADSGGKVPPIYVPPGSYKIRITDGADCDATTLFERDNYVVTDIDAINANNYPVTAKTADYTIASTDDGAVLAVDPSGPGTVAITAEAQVLANGFPFCVVNTGATGTITINPDVGETINGSASYTISTQYQSACFVSRGAAGWFIWAERDPAGTFNTATTFNETATFNDDLVAPPVTLTDAATVTWDMSTGTNFVLTIAGNRALAAPTGETVGQFGYLRIINSTTPNTLTFDAAYKFIGGKTDFIDGVVGTAATSLYSYHVRGADDVLLTRMWTSASDSIGIYKEYDLGTFNDSATLTQAHGLARQPALVMAMLENTSTDLSYASGDRIYLGETGTATASGGCTVDSNTTNVHVTCGASFEIVSRATFARAAIDETKWKVILRVYE